jgi:Caspase domain
MARIGLVLLALVTSLWVSLGSALADKRVALVVGNGKYEHVTALPNPKNDAKEIAAKLKALGFDVKLLNDASYNDLREALAELSNAAVGAEIGAVFFAGHGIEVDRQNYLIPTDAKLETDVRVRFEAMPLDDVMAALDGVTGVRLVMLDACRNNPFISSMKVKTANRSISRGLSKVEPSVGSLVSFSAKEGTTAADGTDKHSPYTKALLANLDKPGLEINRLFRIVRDDVLTYTSGEQEPYTYGSTSSAEIFLKEPIKEPPASPVPAQPALPQVDAVFTDFQIAREVGTKEAWDAFLRKHGNSGEHFYISVAHSALRKFEDSVTSKPEEPQASSKEVSGGEVSSPKVIIAKPVEPPKRSKETKSSTPKPDKDKSKKTASVAPEKAKPKENAKSGPRPNALQYSYQLLSDRKLGQGSKTLSTPYGPLRCQMQLEKPYGRKCRWL